MAEYPIPSWLGPQAHFGELYARGAAIGQAIANQRQSAIFQQRQLEQQAVNAKLEAELQTMRISAQMQIAQQEALQRQQQAAIDADYKQMTLKQAQQKMMQDAQQTDARLQLEMFKANTDWQKAARSFDAEAQMSQFIQTNAPTLGLEEATKRGYMQFGHLLGGAMPAGVFPRERQSPSISTIDVPGRGPVSVVQGGQPLPDYGAASMPPTMVAPGMAQFPKSGGGFETRPVESQFTHHYDKKIEEMETNMVLAPYIENRELKANTEKMQAWINSNRRLYDKMVKARDDARKEFDALQPKMPGTTSRSTNDFDFEWTGSTLK